MENKLQHTSKTARVFTLKFLQDITDNFSEKRIIGRGGFGIVYKGVLDNGEEIAVKKLSCPPELGDEQFKNEVLNLMGVQHQNIVQLIGYCYETQNRVAEYNGERVFAGCDERALCLEYLQGNLEDHLSDEPCRLNWSMSYGIIKGICEGLKHLHTGCKNPIYHLDLKPENILLDEDMIAKIGDFGLSRLLVSVQSCVTQTCIGTLGYMPPEYINKQIITPKFDIFSLGVIVIKIMAGRSGYSRCAHTSSELFIELVHEYWRKRLQATMSADISHEVKTCIEIALKCVESDRVKRPTITQIVDELDKIDNAKSSSASKVAEYQRKRDFEKICSSSDSTVSFNDDEPIDIAPPNSVQLVIKSKKEVPLREYNQKVMVELTGGDRPGLDLVAVLDVSGSMWGEKMDDMKAAMQFVVRDLCPIDRLSIVAFNNAAARKCPLRQVTRAKRWELLEIVDGLIACGGTNIEEGLKTGLKVLTDRKFSDNRIVGIVLVSDRQHEASQVPTGNVPVHTFGFSRVDGSAQLLTDGHGLTMAISQCLASLRAVAVQDLHLTLSRVGDESTIQKVTAGVPMVQHSDDSLTVALGYLYCNVARRIVVDLSLPEIESERWANILKVRYSCSSSSGREFVAPPATLTVWRTDVEEEIRWQAAQMILEAPNDARHWLIRYAHYLWSSLPDFPANFFLCYNSFLTSYLLCFTSSNWAETNILTKFIGLIRLFIFFPFFLFIFFLFFYEKKEKKNLCHPFQSMWSNIIRGCIFLNPLMYVDSLDLSTVDFTGIGGPPPTHKFAVSAWTISAVKAVLAADRATDGTYGKLQGEEDYYARGQAYQ
ncbi:uncharacterized protein LOC119338510 [Triticum dicoccoides]|uniref:uncharacterized protein LOC119338510 n=1 Tax=Triticum dicoccoides TaxID=85692 RepID=UPI0018911CBD|nr:uncharacterized protein LOC119338510 [Triticum dicoccoides]